QPRVVCRFLLRSCLTENYRTHDLQVARVICKTYALLQSFVLPRLGAAQVIFLISRPSLCDLKCLVFRLELHRVSMLAFSVHHFICILKKLIYNISDTHIVTDIYMIMSATYSN